MRVNAGMRLGADASMDPFDGSGEAKASWGAPRCQLSWRDRVGPWTSVLFQTYVLYMAGYVARKPLSLTKTLLAEPAPVGFALGVHELGLMDTLYMLAHAVGKFYAGRCIVKFGGLVVLWASCAATALTVLAFAFLSDPATMGAVWMLSGLSTGFTFLAALNVLDGILADQVVGNTVLGLWCTSINLGGIAGNVASAQILSYGWRAVFLWSAALLLPLSALVAFVQVPGGPPADGAGEAKRTGARRVGAKQSSGPSAHVVPGTIALLSNPSVACCAGANLFVKLSKYSFVLWLPAFYVNRLGASAAVASVAATTDDLGGLTGLCFLGVLLARKGYAEWPIKLARDSLAVSLAALAGLASALPLLGDHRGGAKTALSALVMLIVGATSGEIPETVCTVVSIPAIARNLVLDVRLAGLQDGGDATQRPEELACLLGEGDEDVDRRGAKALEPHILSVVSSIGSLGPLLCGPIMTAGVNLLGWDALLYANVAFVSLGAALSALGAKFMERDTKRHKAARQSASR